MISELQKKSQTGISILYSSDFFYPDLTFEREWGHTMSIELITMLKIM